jgi:sentrin-specific protease 8
MSLMLNLTPDPINVKEALPNLTKTSHIFLPINNNTNPTLAEGGTHWSLLVVSSLDGVAFHYDSLGDENERPAILACEKLGKLLGKKLRFVSMRDAPQQENGSDCGVFVCTNMRTLLVDRLLRVDNREKVSMSLRGRDGGQDAKMGRKEMMRVIEGFRKEGERRRSRSASPWSGRGSGGQGEKSRSPPRIGDEQEEEERRGNSR